MAKMGKGILEVKLLEAKGLLDADFLGDIDPYVVLRYRNQERKSSVARGQGQNPTWNETFKFLVQYPGAANIPHKLILQIMDKDTFTADDVIGEATIHVEDLILLGLETGVGELHPSKYSVVLPNQSYCGHISIGLTFTPNVTKAEEDEEELGGWRHSFHH